MSRLQIQDLSSFEAGERDLFTAQVPIRSNGTDKIKRIMNIPLRYIRAVAPRAKVIQGVLTNPDTGTTTTVTMRSNSQNFYGGASQPLPPDWEYTNNRAVYSFTFRVVEESPPEPVIEEKAA